MSHQETTVVKSACPRGTMVPLLASVMVSVMLAWSANVYGEVCILPGNGSRTIDLPAECAAGYISPDDYLLMTHNPDQPNSIPEGSSVRVEISMQLFSSIVRKPGGSFGPSGEIQNFFAGMPFMMSGTGELVSFSRLGLLSGVEVETHSARQIPADEQDTDIELVSLVGQTPPFDGVFSLFRLTIGTANGLPESLGKVSLVMVKDGICQGGQVDGEPCADDVHCRSTDLCAGGPNDGLPCLDLSDCPDGDCVAVSTNDGPCFCAYCDGGDNIADPCVDNTECPGGSCETAVCEPKFYTRSYVDLKYQIEYETRTSLSIPEALRGRSGTSTGTIRLLTGAIPTLGLYNQDGGGREININPGDGVTIEALVRELAPQELGTFQVKLPLAAEPVGLTWGSVSYREGVCVGQPYDGEPCFSNRDCHAFGVGSARCEGNDPVLDLERPDFVFAEVFACQNGENHGEPCVVDDPNPLIDHCPGKSCVGGSNHQGLCTDDSECPGLSCVGGSNDGILCTNNADCLDGSCERATCEEGTCGSSMIYVKAVSPDDLWPGPVVGALFMPPVPENLPIVEEHRYLAEFTYVSSPDACGDFKIECVKPGTDSSSQTFLIGREQVSHGFDFVPVGAIVHLPPCVPCDDGDAGTCNDILVQGECAGIVDPNPGPPYIVHGLGGKEETYPCTGYICPRLESDNGTDLNQGIDRLTIVFSEPIRALGGGPLGLNSFKVTNTGGGMAPWVRAVNTADNVTVEIVLDRFITLQEWTTVWAVVEDECGNRIESGGDFGRGQARPDRIDIASLPGDVNQSGQVTPDDLIDLRQLLTTGSFHGDCDDLLYFDIDRDTVMPEPQDLIRFRQIIAGTSPATQSWNLATINAPQP